MRDGFGFGYKRDEKGNLIRKNNNTHDIWLGEGVEVGEHTCIDKGSYRDTVIGENTKLDNLVHVGHNAKIGRNCLIVAGAVIGGSAEIGDCCYIGMNASIRNRVKIGKHVLIGAGAVVVDDIPDFDIVAGNPAISIKQRVKLSKDDRYHMVGY